jgi:(p)ppGpp synthase/HD superfamily hydrolase
MTVLTDRFDRAVAYARQRHHTQTRKGTDIPYVAHLLATAALALEAGGDENAAIAALLHDTLEDRQHTGVTFEELDQEFGPTVARIVRECSDTEDDPKRPWRQRKVRYIDSLRGHDADTLLVASADKLHNARSILADYREIGEALWERFNPDSDQLWYYRSLADVFTELGTPLAGELDRAVGELEAEVRAR